MYLFSLSLVLRNFASHEKVCYRNARNEEAFIYTVLVKGEERETNKMRLI